MVKSQALEANIADYHVEVSVDAKFLVFQEVMERYYGLMEGLQAFLKELSHPYRNWQFIIREARGYCLEYFHLIRSHPKGPRAAALFVEIFGQAIEANDEAATRSDAVDNLLLFIQKMVKEAGTQRESFEPVIQAACRQIEGYPTEVFRLFVMSYYQLKRLAQTMLQQYEGDEADWSAVNRLLARYFRQTYAYWLGEEDPRARFAEEEISEAERRQLYGYVADLTPERLQNWRKQLEGILRGGDLAARSTLEALTTLPGYGEIVEAYRRVPRRLDAAAGRIRRSHYCKLVFLLHMMHIAGLAAIHEETLRDINRTLSRIIPRASFHNAQVLIEKTFSILRERADTYPATALNCILTMGKGVYHTDEIDLVNFFIDAVIELGFQAPMVRGVGNDWQIQVNSAHIRNIRTWLQIIELNPKWSVRMLSGLIIHLSLSGIFVKDIDLFPRDITRLLNSRIGPVYNLVKQLARLFPVYFNDIGAEGRLRDISTEIDEITHRRDPLIHFLRKQSHVESSNRIVPFMESVIQFWTTGDRTILGPYLPPAIFSRVDADNPHVAGMRRIFSYLSGEGFALPAELLSASRERLEALIDATPDASREDRQRAKLAASFYRLLCQKYKLDFVDIASYVSQLKMEGFPQLERLEQALAEEDAKRKVHLLLEYLEVLQKVILSEKTYATHEDIYKKRHITVDIPSMYGSYHEMKFDCLGLTFRIESLINVLLEEQIAKIDLTLITKATFFQIYDLLILFDKALKVDGIASAELERWLDFLAHSLEARGFTFTQYLDIFKGFAQAVKNIINDYFNNIYEQNLSKIIDQLAPGEILPKYLPRGDDEAKEKLEYRISEIFLREKIALSLGLQQLDQFLSRILVTLFDQANKLPKNKLRLLLNYDPKRAVTFLERPKRLVSGIVHLGNKGLNMVKLKNFGLPVPPGFIVTTEVYRSRQVIDDYPPAVENLHEQITRQIRKLEAVTGKSFGAPFNPLLCSVRSGSSISQPGMMDTFLNVGINEAITEGLAQRTDNPWFAWDNYRRFVQCYGMARGLERDAFDAIIADFKKRQGVALKRELSGEQMQAIALTYKEMLHSHGVTIPDDPMEQLYATIKTVFDSWESAKANTYRKIIGISDDWGTAVTVQAMVFGNLGRQSGSGVIFTHNPRWSGDTLRLWGDFTLGNQGEDVVSGLVHTMPISISQQEIEMRETDITLESHFPEIYGSLKDFAEELIDERGWSPQEMEFTFESPRRDDLYVLQTRDMVMRERQRVARFDPGQSNQAATLGHGLGVSGGAMNGRVVFTLEEIEYWRKHEPQTPLILVRGDTVPDDIREIHASDGLLTARGGVTSHAAVVVHRLGKVCVVGCGNLACDESDKVCDFDGVRLKSGEYISIDGRDGAVFQGRIDVLEI